MKRRRVKLTTRFVESPQRIPKEGREDVADTVVPGLLLRSYASGRRTYALEARYPRHPKNPARRELGNVAVTSLEEARGKACRWLELIAHGIDPEVELEREKQAALRAQRGTFAHVWEAFWAQHASKLDKAKEAGRAGAAFLRLWGHRSAAEIEPAEIADYFRSIAGKPAEARNRLGHLRRMYSWAIGSGGFGLNANPCAVLKPADLIGRKEGRDRILADDEIRRVWSAADEAGYPFGAIVRMLLLTGQRLSEVGEASWPEIDFDKVLWTIPAPRMKMDRAHVVPLAADTVELLRSLPRFSGPYIFTTTDGRRPFAGFSHAKRRLDAASGVQAWVLHDIRRTMRTHLSALPVTDMVRELVIAHAKPGLHKVYDLHSYETEKREALQLWERRLRGILSPKPPVGVAGLEAERARRVAVA
jgi:integrase